MREALPVLEPITTPLGLRLVDMREASRGERAAAIEIITGAMETDYPPEIHCDSPVSDRLDRRAGRGAHAGRHLAKFYESQSDYAPVRLVVFERHEVVGVWQWIGIRSVHGPDTVAISAGWYPSFVGLDEGALVSRSLDLVEYFGRNAVPLRDGQRLELVRAWAPLFTKFDRPETSLIRRVRDEIVTRRLRSSLTLRDGEQFVEIRFG